MNRRSREAMLAEQIVRHERVHDSLRSALALHLAKNPLRPAFDGWHVDEYTREVAKLIDTQAGIVARLSGTELPAPFLPTVIAGLVHPLSSLEPGEMAAVGER